MVFSVVMHSIGAVNHKYVGTPIELKGSANSLSSIIAKELG